MKRKDYVMLAQTLKTAYACNPGAEREYHRRLCQDFAFHLQSDNPAFDRARFLEACGV